MPLSPSWRGGGGREGGREREEGSMVDESTTILPETTLGCIHSLSVGMKDISLVPRPSPHE